MVWHCGADSGVVLLRLRVVRVVGAVVDDTVLLDDAPERARAWSGQRDRSGRQMSNGRTCYFVKPRPRSRIETKRPWPITRWSRHSMSKSWLAATIWRVTRTSSLVDRGVGTRRVAHFAMCTFPHPLQTGLAPIAHPAFHQVALPREAGAGLHRSAHTSSLQLGSPVLNLTAFLR